MPLIASWKGTAPEGRVLEDFVDFSDFFATFAELAGAKLPHGVTLDSRSFALQLRGELFDMSDAPFVEKAVPAETASEQAKAARRRLQAVLDKLNPAAGKMVPDKPKTKRAGRKKK